MTAYINKLKDADGNQQLPITHERAVRDDNGTTLESKMQNLEGAMDKAYVAGSDNGMGRITLPKNMVSDVNTLTQSMMQATNTIYIIQYDFTLGADITVPAGCVLQFDGGSFANASGNNYTIKGHFSIKDCHHQIFKDVNFEADETYLGVNFIRPEWFGAKGDYDYTNETGTDDSASISLAILNANYAKVNKIKFSAVTYYVTSPIEITNGDILFEGVYATEREEDVFTPIINDITPNRNSCIISNANNCIINITENATHPIRIERLNFYSTNSNYDLNCIEFNSEFGGPLWPFTIEHCRFVGFDKAIYINSQLIYCLFDLIVESCAFDKCNWCVYCEDNNRVGNFRFISNHCHHNARILYMQCGVGTHIINDNNMEGTTSYNGNKPYIGKDYGCILNFDNNRGGHLEFKHNYFENIVVPIAKFNEYGTTTKCDIDANEYAASTALYTMRFEGTGMFIAQKCDSPNIEIGCSVFATDVIYPSMKVINDKVVVNFNELSFGEPTIIQKDEKFIWNSSGTISMKNGNLICVNKTAVSNVSYFAFTPPAIPTNGLYMVGIIDCGCIQQESGAPFSITNGTTDGMTISLNKGYRYTSIVRKYESGTTLSEYTLLQSYEYIASFHSAKIVFSEYSTQKSLVDIMELPAKNNIYNTVLNNLGSIGEANIGDRISLLNANNEITEKVWNGTSWV